MHVSPLLKRELRPVVVFLGTVMPNVKSPSQHCTEYETSVVVSTTAVLHSKSYVVELEMWCVRGCVHVVHALTTVSLILSLPCMSSHNGTVPCA